MVLNRYPCVIILCWFTGQKSGNLNCFMFSWPGKEGIHLGSIPKQSCIHGYCLLWGLLYIIQVTSSPKETNKPTKHLCTPHNDIPPTSTPQYTRPCPLHPCTPYKAVPHPHCMYTQSSAHCLTVKLKHLHFLSLSVFIWRCEHAMFCVEILMYNVSLIHSCLYVYI